MEAQVQTKNSPCRVCGGQSDTKADFLSEQFGITDFKISPLGPGIKGTFLITVQKSSSSYIHNKKELCEGNITYRCNVSNWLTVNSCRPNMNSFLS
jgi:hypothetical protein